MNTHLYLFDCARSTNIDQQWCLMENKRTRKKMYKLDALNEFFFLIFVHMRITSMMVRIYVVVTYVCMVIKIQVVYYGYGWSIMIDDQ